MIELYLKHLDNCSYNRGIGDASDFCNCGLEKAKKEYEELLDAQKLLDALEGAGVDNWEGYDYAIQSLE